MVLKGGTMRHVVVYHGPFEENFHLFKPGRTTYRKAGDTRPVIPVTASGIVFAYMNESRCGRTSRSRGVFMIGHGW